MLAKYGPNYGVGTREEAISQRPMTEEELAVFNKTKLDGYTASPELIKSLTK
jgi:hypothetical protein